MLKPGWRNIGQCSHFRTTSYPARGATDMARLRTFIGVDIGKAIRERAVALQEKLAQSANGVKWVEAENLHVTLLFLGEVDDREVAAVCRAVSQETANHAPFEISVEKLGCFPNPRRPHVLWI